MRFSLAVLALTLAAPLSAQRPDPLAFLRKGPEVTNLAFVAYRDQPYAPVRTGEVRAAGFLTELHTMPFGRVLGPVAPPRVHSTQSGEAATIGTIIAVLPPEGAAYQRGDTVMLAETVRGPRGWGDIVTPAGLAVIGDHSPRQTLATVIAMYGPIRGGQVSLPVEPVANPGRVQAVAITGPSGEVITSQAPRELQQVGGMLFVNLGRGAGMRIGDFVQIRRRPVPRPNESDTIDDLVATAQVVHVGDKSSTVRLIRVLDPDIRSGAPVVRVATLPN